MLLLTAAVVLLVSVLTVLVILRLSGRRDPDLLASQLRSLTGSEPVSSYHSSMGAQPQSDRPPGTDGFPPWAPFADVDDTTRRRVEALAASGRRVQAIDLLRTAMGCRLAEAKAVVDRLPREGGRKAGPGRQNDRDIGVTGRRNSNIALHRPAQSPPGYDLGPNRPAGVGTQHLTCHAQTGRTNCCTRCVSWRIPATRWRQFNCCAT
jgi:hypothetical protein